MLAIGFLHIVHPILVNTLLPFFIDDNHRLTDVALSVILSIHVPLRHEFPQDAYKHFIQMTFTCQEAFCDRNVNF